tara:strand:- start:819 stop:1142 length:324 start_codon:yes stop_codon:yes gene_type:complete
MGMTRHQRNQLKEKVDGLHFAILWNLLADEFGSVNYDAEEKIELAGIVHEQREKVAAGWQTMDGEKLLEYQRYAEHGLHYVTHPNLHQVPAGWLTKRDLAYLVAGSK